MFACKGGIHNGSFARGHLGLHLSPLWVLTAELSCSSFCRGWRGRKSLHSRWPRHSQSISSDSSIPVRPRPISLSGERWLRRFCTNTHQGGQRSHLFQNCLKMARRQEAWNYNSERGVIGLRNPIQNHLVLPFASLGSHFLSL